MADAVESYTAMMGQCTKLQDCFAVLDIVGEDEEITSSADYEKERKMMRLE